MVSKGIFESSAAVFRPFIKVFLTVLEGPLEYK